MGSPGSVSYLFRRLAGEEGYRVTMPIPVTDQSTQSQLEELLAVVRDHEGVEEIYCAGDWPGKNDDH